LGCRGILQTIEDQLDARRDAKFVKNAKEIIAHDCLLGGGMDGARPGGYFVTAFLGLLGWFAMSGGIRSSLILGVGVVGGLLAAALCLGAGKAGAAPNSRCRAQH
jgi:hypothetical protein